MAIYTLQPHILMRSMGEETVVLDTRKGEYFAINATAAEMLASLLETQDPVATAAIVAARHNADQAKVYRDLTDLIETMCREGWFTVHD